MKTNRGNLLSIKIGDERRWRKGEGERRGRGEGKGRKSSGFLPPQSETALECFLEERGLGFSGINQ